MALGNGVVQALLNASGTPMNAPAATGQLLSAAGVPIGGVSAAAPGAGATAQMLTQAAATPPATVAQAAGLLGPNGAPISSAAAGNTAANAGTWGSRLAGLFSRGGGAAANVASNAGAGTAGAGWGARALAALRGGGAATTAAGTTPTMLGTSGLSQYILKPTMGAGLRAAGLAGAGYMAGQGFERAVGSRDGTWDDAGRNALAGAGLGAAAGSFVPVVGTGIGALVGGGLGLAHGFLTGKDSKETEYNKAVESGVSKITETMDKFSVSDDLRETAMAQLQLQLEGVSSATEAKQIIKDFQANLAAVIPQDLMDQRAQRRQQATMAAAQAFLAPMLKEQLDNRSIFAAGLSEAMNDNAASITNPNLRGVITTQAKQVPLDVASSNAYMLQQAMMTPAIYGYQTPATNTGAPATDFNSIVTATPNQLPSGQDAIAAILNGQ